MGWEGDKVSEWVRRMSAAVVVGTLGVSLAACGAPDDSAPHPGQPSPKLMMLRLATTDSISSLDPAGPYDVGSRTVQANLYQTLLTILPDKPTRCPMRRTASSTRRRRTPAASKST